jgi:hypothetical protein
MAYLKAALAPSLLNMARLLRDARQLGRLTMEKKTNISGRKKFIESIKAKQRNTVWPDTLINSRGVDEFLWKGSPDPSLVQRLAAFIFGLTFVLLGVVLRLSVTKTIPVLVQYFPSYGFCLEGKCS